jgi:acyl carrier protein
MSSADKLEEGVALKDQGMDSLDFANLLLHFEEMLGIRISDEEAEKLRSIHDVVSIVNDKVAARR